MRRRLSGTTWRVLTKLRVPYTRWPTLASPSDATIVEDHHEGALYALYLCLGPFALPPGVMMLPSTRWRPVARWKICSFDFVFLALVRCFVLELLLFCAFAARGKYGE